MKKIIIIILSIILFTSCDNKYTQIEPVVKKEEVKIMNIKINNIDNKITLEKNETVDELIKKLPLKIKMTELNGNEKYSYLDFSLPTSKEKIKKINKGDVMLYEDNCLVIFYESFITPYSYTKIGVIENIDLLDNIKELNEIELIMEG